ncbi:MAG: hypothetical protein CM1200mP41_36070 [Gammaproteobacteria bacterium]|nr:MAG: hypothetical protein CM1200mP41_36070 [Gammaproteobacteria bacterium]
MARQLPRRDMMICKVFWRSRARRSHHSYPDRLHAEQAIAAAGGESMFWLKNRWPLRLMKLMRWWRRVALPECSWEWRITCVGTGPRALARQIHEGVFGDIWHANARWTSKALDTTNWRASDEVGRWWSLAGVGTHSLDWLRWMLVLYAVR